MFLFTARVTPLFKIKLAFLRSDPKMMINLGSRKASLSPLTQKMIPSTNLSRSSYLISLSFYLNMWQHWFKIQVFGMKLQCNVITPEKVIDMVLCTHIQLDLNCIPKYTMENILENLISFRLFTIVVLHLSFSSDQILRILLFWWPRESKILYITFHERNR